MEIMSTFCSTTNFRVTSERFYYNTISYLVERDPLSTQNILSSFYQFFNSFGTALYLFENISTERKRNL